MAEPTRKVTIAKTYVMEKKIEVPAWMFEPEMKNDLEEFLLAESQKMTALQIAASDWTDTTVTDDENEDEEIFSWS